MNGRASVDEEKASEYDDSLMRCTRRQKYYRCLAVLIIVIAVAFLVVLGKAYFDGELRSVDSLQRYIGKYGVFAPLFLTAFQAAQVVLPVLPGFLGCAAGAVMFGPVVGFLCNYIGISAGSVIAFFLARRFGVQLIIDLFPGKKYQKWSTWAAKSKSYTVFLFVAMVLPMFPDDYFCYLSGITKMRMKKFLWIIILGKPWCILAYSLGFSLLK